MIVVILIVGMNTVLILKYNEVSRLDILEKNANDFTMFMENSLIAVFVRFQTVSFFPFLKTEYEKGFYLLFWKPKKWQYFDNSI